MPSATIILTLVMGLTLLAHAGHAHESTNSPPPAAVEAEAAHEGSDLLSILTRGLMDRRLDVVERLKIAALRRQWLADLVERDPGEVLRQAITEGERAALDPTLQPLVEEEERHEGEMEVYHSDGPQGGAYHYELRTPSGQRLGLHFAQDGPRVLTGTRVEVRGVRVQDALALGSTAAVTVLQAPILPSTFGEHKVLVLLLKFLDTPATSVPSTSAVDTMMFGPGSSVTNFYRENSYQQTWMTGTVVGPVPIPLLSSGCDYKLIASLANTAAAGLGVVLGQFRHVVYAFPMSGCAWWGFGSVGGNPGQVWVNGALQNVVASHELGHNLGLYHSHALECGAVTIGSNCSSIDYGDVFDVMGSGNGPNHFNAVQKDMLGWLDYGASPAVTDVTASGTYTIAPLETSGTGSKALRVLTAAGDYLYVEYRRPVGFDTYLSGNSSIMNGVVVHYWDGTPNGVYLLDMTPSTTSWTDSPLTVGATFSDTAGKVSITPVWANAASAGVSVNVASPCARVAPSLALSPSAQEAAAGSTLSFTLAVTNNGAGCGASVFALQSTLPPGWAATFSPPSLTLAEGVTGSTTLSITSPMTAVPATYGFGVSTSEGGLVGSSGGSYTVSPPPDVVSPPPGDPGTFVDTFARTDAPALGNGWTMAAGNISIVSGEARNDVWKTLHVAVQPALSGADQSVSGTFASASNNVGPRFGVLLRYRDPRNYYLCYRQIGGASVLRIARVVNGVEKVLRQVSLANPVAGAMFTLSCQASGTSLTLQLDGVSKATAADSTFAAGSVGFVMGGAAGGGVSHRADSFTATVQ